MSQNNNFHTDLENLEEEVHQKTGRNLLFFQKMELTLKYILLSCNISGYAKELTQKKETYYKKIQKQTMGHLVKQCLKKNLTEHYEVPEAPDELDDIHISMAIAIGFDEAQSQKIKQDLESVVDERNDLVHHLLSKFGSETDTVKRRLSIIQYLDKQYDDAKAKNAFLQSCADTIHKLKKEYSDFLLSEEGDKFFNAMFLRSSPLVVTLRDVENKMARKDGWTSLHTAASLIGNSAPEELVEMKEKYGHKKFKNFILATQMFDLKEEITDKGGIRLLYRSKTDGIR
ncbi:MAG: hypothetical protein ACQETR_09335 [Thermodesulfobacteriota bacterium]